MLPCHASWVSTIQAVRVASSCTTLPRDQDSDTTMGSYPSAKNIIADRLAFMAWAAGTSSASTVLLVNQSTD